MNSRRHNHLVFLHYRRNNPDHGQKRRCHPVVRPLMLFVFGAVGEWKTRSGTRYSILVDLIFTLSKLFPLMMRKWLE